MIIKKNARGLTASELIVILSYCIYVLLQIFSSTQMSNISSWNLISKCGSLLVIGGIIFSFLTERKISLKWLIISGCIIAGGGLVALQSEQLMKILILTLLIFAGIHLKSDNFLKAYLITAIAAVLLTLFLYATGIYGYDSILQGTRERLYMGFTYTTYLPNYFFHIILVYFTVKKTTINMLETIVIVVLNYIIDLWTDTSAVYYGIYILLLLLWFFRFTGSRLFSRKIVGILMTMFMPALAAVIIFLSYTFNRANSFYNWLDNALTHRLALGYSAINRYGFSLFGMEIEWITGRLGTERTEDYFFVDSSYLNIALTYGIITFAFVMVAFAIIMWKAYKERKYVLCIVLLVLSIHSFTDPQLFDARYDPFLMILGISFLKHSPLPIGSVIDNNRYDRKYVNRQIKYSS